MTPQYIVIAIADGIATITLNRPDKRNAFNGEFIQELSRALQALSADKKVRVLIINGNGPQFCAGADIAWMQKMAAASEDVNYTDAQMLADLLYQLYLFPKPTIVLAHGKTLGGGLGILSACDIAIAARDANFGFPEVKIGLAASSISPYVIRAMGERAAHYYFLTGESFDAEEARRIGLVHQITENNTLLEVGMTLGKRLLQNGHHALQATKQLIRSVTNEKITTILAQKTAEHLANLRSSAEAQEGLQAFLDKRIPRWGE